MHNITGKIYINKSQQYGGYSTIIKNGDEKMYLSVSFKKSAEPTEDNLQINIKSAFLSFYKTKQGLQKVKIQIMDYEKVTTSNIESVTQEEIEDLPF